MTAIEKAKELVNGYYKLLNKTDTCIYGDGCKNDKSCQLGPYVECWWDYAKQCALIAVDELLKHERDNHSPLSAIIDYLEEVKQEIEKL